MTLKLASPTIPTLIIWSLKINYLETKEETVTVRSTKNKSYSTDLEVLEQKENKKRLLQSRKSGI